MLPCLVSMQTKSLDIGVSQHGNIEEAHTISVKHFEILQMVRRAPLLQWAP